MSVLTIAGYERTTCVPVVFAPVNALQTRSNQAASEGQDLPCTYLSQHKLECNIMIIMLIIVNAGTT